MSAAGSGKRRRAPRAVSRNSRRSSRARRALHPDSSRAASLALSSHANRSAARLGLHPSSNAACANAAQLDRHRQSSNAGSTIARRAVRRRKSARRANAAPSLPRRGNNSAASKSAGCNNAAYKSAALPAPPRGRTLLAAREVRQGKSADSVTAAPAVHRRARGVNCSIARQAVPELAAVAAAEHRVA